MLKVYFHISFPYESKLTQWLCIDTSEGAKKSEQQKTRNQFHVVAQRRLYIRLTFA